MSCDSCQFLKSLYGCLDNSVIALLEEDLLNSFSHSDSHLCPFNFCDPSISHGVYGNLSSLLKSRTYKSIRQIYFGGVGGSSLILFENIARNLYFDDQFFIVRLINIMFKEFSKSMSTEYSVILNGFRSIRCHSNLHRSMKH